MKASLAAWGVFFAAAGAALSSATATSADGFRDEAQEITKACDDDNGGEDATAVGIVDLVGPLLRDEKPLGDHEDPARVLKGGSFVSNQPVHFTHSTFVVANEQARHDVNPKLKPFPTFEAKGKKYRGRGSTRHDAPHDSTSSSTGNGIVFTARSSISGEGGDDEDSINTNNVNSGVVAARRAARALPLSTNLTVGYRVFTRMLEKGSNDHMVRKSRSTVGGWLPRDRGATRLIADYSVSKRMLEVFNNLKCDKHKKNTNITNPMRGWVYNNQRLTKRSTVFPRDPWVRKPTCALQVGEMLTATLRSADGHSALWPGVDGSLRFGNTYLATGTASSDEGVEEESGPGAMRFTTLIGSEPEKAWKALGARLFIPHDEVGPDDHATPNAKGTVVGWLPRARRAQTNLFGVEKSSGKREGTVGGSIPRAQRATTDRTNICGASGKEMGTVGGWLPRAQRTTSSRVNMGGASGKDGTVGGWLPGARGGKRTISNVDHASSKTNGTIGGWLPRVRGGTMRNMSEDIPMETRNLEEVCVSVTNKGCVKVTVDGTTVLSKSGKYKWDWLNTLPWIRPKDDSYEMHVTETGMEVRLGERKVWGVDVDEWMD